MATPLYDDDAREMVFAHDSICYLVRLHITTTRETDLARFILLPKLLFIRTIIDVNHCTSLLHIHHQFFLPVHLAERID
jgi:hypothetical protein